MRRRPLLLVTLAWFLFAPRVEGAEAQRLLLRVEGMACPLCAKAVESTLRGVEGVISAEASFLRGEALISYDPSRVKALDLIQAVNTKTPYRASLPALLLKGTGQGPPVQPETLKAIPGVEAIEVHPEEGLLLRYNPSATSAEAIIASLRERGYAREVVPFQDSRGGLGWAFYLAIAAGLGALLLGLRFRGKGRR